MNVGKNSTTDQPSIAIRGSTGEGIWMRLMWEGFSEVRPHFTSENPFSVMYLTPTFAKSEFTQGKVDPPLCITQTCNPRIHRVETLTTRHTTCWIPDCKMCEHLECIYTSMESDCYIYQGIHSKGRSVILQNVENTPLEIINTKSYVSDIISSIL